MNKITDSEGNTKIKFPGGLGGSTTRNGARLLLDALRAGVEVIANPGTGASNVRVDCAKKIMVSDALARWRHELRKEGKRLVVTNGCFDLLHAGHVTYLEAARNQGEALLVGINSDASVRGLKGPGRPLNSEADRALVVAALQAVDAVTVFAGRDAIEFLRTSEPDIYVKGGDYTMDTINQDERRLVERAGGKIVLLAHVPGKSTTALLRKMGER